MANELRAQAILVFTIHGSMARYTAWMRPRFSPVFAICDQPAVAHSLTLNHGVIPITIPFNHGEPEENIRLAMRTLLKRGLLQPGNTAVVVTSMEVGDGVADVVQMRKVS